MTTRVFFRRCLLAVVVWMMGNVAIAQEVPPYLVHQGRLTDALSAPIEGTLPVTFNLFAEETGGTALWTEDQTVLFANGYYNVTLGIIQTLDPDLFDGSTMFIEVVINGEALAPRLAVRSVPYAMKSRNAVGDLTPMSVTVGGASGTVIDENGISIGGTVIIDGSGAWSGPAPTVSFNDLLDRPFTLSDLNCVDGEIAQVVGGAWTCTPASSADTLSGLGCAEGQIPAFIGGLWTCSDNTDTDTNTTYAAGTGITISGANNTIDVDTNAVQARVGGSCAAGLSIRQINADGTVICEADDDTNTTYAAGAGITISGATNDIAVNTATIQARVSGSCAANESIRQINADGTVLCEPDTDTDTNTTYAAGTGITITGATNAINVNPAAVQTRVGGSCVAGQSIRQINADGTVLCEVDDDANTTYTSGTGLTLTGTTFAVNPTTVQTRVLNPCPTGQFIRQINQDGTVVCAAAPAPTSITLAPDAASLCDNTKYGQLRWTGSTFEGCSPSGWLVLASTRDGSSASAAGVTCLQIHTDFPTLLSGVYWIDLDGLGNGQAPFQVYCDMETDGGGWTKLTSIHWSNFFTAANWNNANAADPLSLTYSILNQRTAFADAGCYTFRYVVGNSGNWLSAPAHKTVWEQCHDPFTQTTNGSDYTFISGDVPSTCGGFNGLHNRYQGYSYTSDVDSGDATGCWWMQVVPHTNYGGPGYLEGYGGTGNYHQWQTLWVR